MEKSMNMKLNMSNLNKTWIFDLDGTVVVHNGYRDLGEDILLEGAKEFINKLSEKDYVLIITSRSDQEKDNTINFLKKNNIRFDQIIFGVPYGERIVINDRKPSGLDMAYSINTNRNYFPLIDYTEDF